ncbi:MAG: type III PLP-dependent enzyme, partial [Woeseiaceae bacterium]
MITTYESVEDLLQSRQPRLAVYCIYPHVYVDTARRFVDRFPGRVLYAVKANDDPSVVNALHQGGINHFDCASLPEIEMVTDQCPGAICYLMNPVRIDGHAERAQQMHGVRHFMVDHLTGLAPLLQEIDVQRSVIFARMRASHDSAHQDLSTKFGATPEEMPELLTAIR